MVYMLKVAVITALLYIIYVLLFRNSTDHRINRFFLLLVVPFALICPLLKHLQFFIINPISEYVWINDFLEPAGNVAYEINQEQMPVISIRNLIIIIYLSGVTGMFVHFLNSIVNLIRLEKNQVKFHSGNIIFVKTGQVNAPFSFFNRIFLPIFYEKLNGLDTIIEHEKVHARQLHSLDLLLTEFFCIVFWFNPFAFLLKRSLKSVHEYLADEGVINVNCNSSMYLDLIRSGCELSFFSGITNQFSYLSIKKRIKMITKNKTAKSWRFSYLLILPVLFIMIQAFSNGDLLNNPPKKMPVEGGKIVLQYGYKGEHPITHKEFIHGGIDIKAPEGTQVVSAGDGVIIKAANEKNWGNLVIIRHDEEHETWYAHLKDFTVKNGDMVYEGQVIGHVGTTGISTGPHLHFEVRKGGEKVNPEDYISFKDK